MEFMTETPMAVTIAPRAHPAPRLRECPVCGQFQTMPVLRQRGAACCVRCASLLRQDRTDPAGRTLALATAALLLFALAATLPLMSLDLGAGRRITLVAGPEALDKSGMWALGLVVLATTMLAPLLKLLATIWVMLGIRLCEVGQAPGDSTAGTPQAPGSLIAVFRSVEWLQPWSMVEVFMLGVFVAYTKLSELAPVRVGGAVYALGALMLLMAATDAVLDHEAIWERLEPAGLELRPQPAPALRIGCDACGEVSDGSDRDAGGRPCCPRCFTRLRFRKPQSLSRGWALTAAAAVLYIPANTLPVLTVIRLGQGAPATILEGVDELARAGQWPLAALVFVASIAVPLLKLGGLAILLLTTQLRMRSQLAERTRLYKIVEAVGRWSMIDVFMISILTALVQMGTLASVTPGPGALCFGAVVILTMLAAGSFDPRLMWDAAMQRR